MALRVAACHGFEQVWCTGKRIRDEVEALNRVPREERMKCYKEIKLVWSERFPDFQPGVTPVAVEFRPNSENLFKFQHPENPVYVFGPEDGSLERDVLTKCHRFVCIDTAECLNLAVAVGTMLYDYRLKEFQNGST